MKPEQLVNTLADNLQRLMSQHGELRTQGSLGKKAGIDQRTVGRILNKEHQPTLDKVAALAGAYGVPVWELLVPKDQRAPVERATASAAADGYIRLPLLQEAAAGAGRVATGIADEVVEHVDVLEAWVRRQWNINPRSLRLLTARGNSLKGVIEDGDLMFVEPVTDYRGDGIYVLSIEDRLLVKMLNLRVSDGLLSVESTNGMAPESIRLDDLGHRVLVHGRVLGSWSLRRF